MHAASPPDRDAPNSFAASVEALAPAWYAQLAEHALSHRSGETALRLPLPNGGGLVDALSGFVSIALNQRRSLLVLVPNDEQLPALSNALDLALRPLCLVLPSAEFAARIALRATLSLLKSRLARDSDDEQGVAWRVQRERLADQTALWAAAQEWNAANDRSPWPGDVAALFPVRILPQAAAVALPPQAADITLAVGCDPGVHGQLSGRWQLCLGTPTATTGGPVTAVDETAQLRAELAQLTQDVGDLELELATAQAEVAEFTERYYGLIGRRMTELDVLQAKLARQRVGSATPAGAAPEDEAEASATKAEAQAARSSAEQASFEDARQARPEAPAFRPDATLKRRFRELAQKIHPDRAENDTERAWRTQLMSEANRAYRAGDAEALAEIASLWAEQRQAPATACLPTAAPVVELRRQLARMRRRFAEIKDELSRLFGSKLYELFLAARHAGRYGRDLLREMADRLDRQIADTLAAINAA